MLEPYERAALIPAEPGVPWHSFLKSRFVESSRTNGKALSLAIVVQAVQQQSHVHADIVGLVELYSGSALPVVLGFVGQLNLENREFSIRQDQSGKNFTGKISENGLVMTLHEMGSSKPIYLVHEPTLAQLV